MCGDVTMAEHVYLTIRYVNHVSSIDSHSTKHIAFIALFLIEFITRNRAVFDIVWEPHEMVIIITMTVYFHVILFF